MIAIIGANEKRITIKTKTMARDKLTVLFQSFPLKESLAVLRPFSLPSAIFLDLRSTTK